MISTSEFEELRPYLFSIAYRMLGSASDSEDVLQDAWLRAAAMPQNVESPRAWFTTVTTRLCIDRLKSARAVREHYVGTWLPEPVPSTAIAAPEDPEQRAAREESIRLAFLLLLESLSPSERAAFLLREVFDYGYSEIASILETTEAATRQLVHRAKSRISEGRPRFEPSPERHREIVMRFLEAAQTGELSPLQSLLASDVVYAADGGGKVAAARRTVQGSEAVGKLFLGLARKAAAEPGAWNSSFADVNSEPALLAWYRDTLDSVHIFSIDGERISAIRVIRNPDKIAWFAQHAGVAPRDHLV